MLLFSLPLLPYLSLKGLIWRTLFTIRTTPTILWWLPRRRVCEKKGVLRISTGSSKLGCRLGWMLVAGWTTGCLCLMGVCQGAQPQHSVNLWPALSPWDWYAVEVAKHSWRFTTVQCEIPSFTPSWGLRPRTPHQALVPHLMWPGSIPNNILWHDRGWEAHYDTS